MKYQLKRWDPNTLPADGVAGTSFMYIVVVTSIVGDPYGFIPPALGSDVIKVSWEKNKTQLEIEAICQQAAIDYVAQKYPNT